MHALVPGTFDPVTNGHLGLIARAARMFDRLTVGVYDGAEPGTLFSAAERLGFIDEALAGQPNATARLYSGTTVGFARQIGAGVLVRGIRVPTDFDYELSLAHMNEALDDSIDTICLISALSDAFISSSLIREVALLGQDVSDWVPANVTRALKDKISNQR